MVTGESMPVTKTTGDKVVGGTMNRSGAFVMRAERVGKEAVLAQIVQMVAQAQTQPRAIQRLALQVSAGSCRRYCRRRYRFPGVERLGA